ncbi:DUF1439 domain-containing protein [Alteromonas aestuariivivens]|uniref:DUF1439 domain-containing protein n=1 Tax=Alteromonas aestuariivivens TaxID=1938339 RepID=A0A3D8M4U3_9ALTE|nr:DUF1439 domain-containing protein [Alteromonas aestuariivivens]RDV24628.1 DUF1439 domain-containing protein [Alteromonas aestuariivivens]
MRLLPWRDRLKFLVGVSLIKMGKLKYDKFSASELSQMIEPAFPRSLPVKIPVGSAELTLLRGEITLPQNSNQVQLQSLAALKISWMGTPLYRAHLVIGITVKPDYDTAKCAVNVTAPTISAIQLINDEYALLKDTRGLISSMLPKGLGNLLRFPFENALNVISAGTSEKTLNYLSLYLSGSMQRVLDYHQPQIQQALEQQLDKLQPSYTLQENHWREQLFRCYGKLVSVDEGELRFWF